MTEGHGWGWGVPMCWFKLEGSIPTSLESLSAFKDELQPSGPGRGCPGLAAPDPVLSLADAAGLVGALALFAHLTADTIVNGSATSHLAPTDHADRECKDAEDAGGDFFSWAFSLGRPCQSPLCQGADFTKDSTFPMLPFLKFPTL